MYIYTRNERRTALVARELCRYSVDIAALSETRFADEGQLTESGAGYTFSGVAEVLKIDGSLVSALLSKTHLSKSSLVPQRA